MTRPPARRALRHVHRHRRKYASAAMIYAAAFIFGADLIHSLSVMPHWLTLFLETQRWTVPAAALAGHAGFILERA